MVTTMVLATQIGELAASIANTESQMRGVKTAITELTAIVNSFQQLDTLYGTLNTFWGRMRNDASAIGTMDDVTAAAISNKSSMISAVSRPVLT